MNVEQFFHVCRSAASIADVREVTVFGAAAIEPWIERARPNVPFWPSLELDLDPGGEELATLVDGCIGEMSLFETTFGVRAHGVTLDAFIAPGDWPSRAEVFFEPRSGVRIRTPHPVDLVTAKLVRGDDRDWEFAVFCARHFSLATGDIEAGLRRIGVERPERCEAMEATIAMVRARLTPTA